MLPTGSLNLILYLFCYQRDCKTTTWCFCQTDLVTLLNYTLCNLVSFWIVLVIGTLCISIDNSLIFATLIEEVEFEVGLMTILIALTCNKPVISSLCLTSYGDIIAWLSLNIFRIRPVASYVADELDASSNFA